MSRAVTASGGVDRNKPCLSFSSQEDVSLSVSWEDSDENPIAEDAPDSVVFEYINGEGGASLTSVTGAAFSADTLTLASFSPTDLAGVYRGRVKLLDVDEEVYRSLPFFMSIESDDFGGGVTVLTVDRFRAYLQDWASQNTLLLVEEFEDELLAEAIITPVRLWNDTIPKVNSHTTACFPYYDYWCLGATAHLLRTFSRILLARNRLKSPGDSLDDSQRADSYMQTGEQFWVEFTLWMSVEKRPIDTESAFLLV